MNAKTKAKELMKKYPDISVFFINPKGEFFTSKNRGELSLEKGQKLEVVRRSDLDLSEKPNGSMNSKDAIVFIKNATSIEDILPFEGDARKTVKEAFDAKKASLKEASGPKE